MDPLPQANEEESSPSLPRAADPSPSKAKRLSIAVALLGMTAVAVAFLAAPSPAKVTVTGRVMAADTGEPIAGAQVIGYRGDDPDRVLASTRANSKGDYSLTLRWKDYRLAGGNRWERSAAPVLAAWAEGYLTHATDLLPALQSTASGEPVLDFVLIPTSGTSSQIQRVTDPLGFVVACVAGWVNRHQQRVIE